MNLLLHPRHLSKISFSFSQSGKFSRGEYPNRTVNLSFLPRANEKKYIAKLLFKKSRHQNRPG